MVWVDKVSLFMANYIHKNVGKTPVNVLRYALNDLINYMLFYLSVVLVGTISGHFSESLIAPIMFSLLRRYSGGIHLSTSKRCTIASASMILFSIYTPINYWYNGLILNAISFMFICIFAPSGSHAPKELHNKFKVVSVLIVSANFFVCSPLLSKVFFIQAVTTIPWLQVALNRYKI